MNASEQIERMVKGLTDWRGPTFKAVRKAVLAADRDIVEEWKWMGTPTYSLDGLIGVCDAHKDKVKVTFAYGAQLPDPHKLFNASLEGNARRAIDYLEGDKVNATALTQLVRAAIERNRSKAKTKGKNVVKPKPTKPTKER